MLRDVVGCCRPFPATSLGSRPPAGTREDVKKGSPKIEKAQPKKTKGVKKCIVEDSKSRETPASKQCGLQEDNSPLEIFVP